MSSDLNFTPKIGVVYPSPIPLARISHAISSEGGQDVASDLPSIAREHCQTDKARAIEGKDGATDCPESPRECEKCGLDSEDEEPVDKESFEGEDDNAVSHSGELSEELQSIDLARQKGVLENKLPKALFDDLENGHLYWEALVRCGSGESDKAARVSGMIRAGEHSEASFPWQKTHPDNIEDFFDKYFITLHMFDPRKISTDGVLKSMGISEQNRYLKDVSPEVHRAQCEKKKELLDSLKQYPWDSLTPEQQESYRVCQWELEHDVEGIKFCYHSFFPKHFFEILYDLSNGFQQFHNLDSVQDFENYNKKMARIPDLIDGILRIQNQQLHSGIIPCRSVMVKTVRFLEEFGTLMARDQPLYKRALNRFIETGLDVRLQVQWGEHIIKAQVIPAFSRMIKFNKLLLRKARPDSGVWSLPNGGEYYLYRLKEATTTCLTPEEIHRIGLNELAWAKREVEGILNDGELPSNGKGLDVTQNVNEEKAKMGFGKSEKEKKASKLNHQKQDPERDRHLPLFRRLAGRYSAYTEGWALYKKRLAYDKGEINTEREKLEFLLDQMIWACRAVADTGIHYKKWTRSETFSYLSKESGYFKQIVEEEIDRSLTFPGRSCSAMAGMATFLELHRKAEKALGETFDIGAFHEFILGVFPLPLSILEESIDLYIGRYAGY